MYTPAANALIADLTTEAERPLAYTVNYVCINVGMGLGPLAGGLLAASSYGWLFAGDIATTMVCAGLIALGVPSTGRTTASAARAAASGFVGPSTFRVWARHPTLVAFCAASAFVVAPLMGLEYVVPVLVRTTLGEALVFVGLVYTINATCILAFSLSIERAIRGRSEAAMMALAAALWSVGLSILAIGVAIGLEMGLAMGWSIPALLASTVVWTLGEIVGSIVIPTYLSRRVAPATKGRMLSLPDAVRSLSAIVCPVALGLLWDGAGVHAVLGVLVATPLVGVVVYTAWWRRELRLPCVVAATP